MTNEGKEIIKQFEAKVYQLIMLYTDARQENERLGKIVENQHAQLMQVRQDYDILKEKYANLQATRSMTVASNASVEDTRQRIAALIKEVDNCITLIKHR